MTTTVTKSDYISALKLSYSSTAKQYTTGKSIVNVTILKINGSVY